MGAIVSLLGKYYVSCQGFNSSQRPALEKDVFYLLSEWTLRNIVLAVSALCFGGLPSTKQLCIHKATMYPQYDPSWITTLHDFRSGIPVKKASFAFDIVCLSSRSGWEAKPGGSNLFRYIRLQCWFMAACVASEITARTCQLALNR